MRQRDGSFVFPPGYSFASDNSFNARFADPCQARQLTNGQAGADPQADRLIPLRSLPTADFLNSAASAGPAQPPDRFLICQSLCSVVFQMIPFTWFIHKFPQYRVRKTAEVTDRICQFCFIPDSAASQPFIFHGRFAKACFLPGFARYTAAHQENRRPIRWLHCDTGPETGGPLTDISSYNRKHKQHPAAS